jgi:enterochelin esterase family protein
MPNPRPLRGLASVILSLRRDLSLTRARLRVKEIGRKECQRLIAEKIEDFWAAAAAQAPIVVGDPQSDDHVLITFLWRDSKAQYVLLYTVPDDGTAPFTNFMKHVTGTDIWHLSYRVRIGWTVSYWFLPSTYKKGLPDPENLDEDAIRKILSRGLLDPRNPHIAKAFVDALFLGKKRSRKPLKPLKFSRVSASSGPVTPPPAAPVQPERPTVRQMLRERHYGKERPSDMPDAPLVPPKVARPEPAPRVKTTATATLRREIRAIRAACRERVGGGEPAAATASECQRQIAAATAKFWDTVAAQTPVISPDPKSKKHALVSFFWRDDKARAVLLFVNRITDEKNLQASLMKRIPGTDVWHISYRMESDWRASYCFIPCYDRKSVADITGVQQVSIRKALDRGIADPRNPLHCQNRAGNTLSVVELKDAPAQPWLGARLHSAGYGNITSQRLAGGHTVWVYEPPTETLRQASAPPEPPAEPPAPPSPMTPAGVPQSPPPNVTQRQASAPGLGALIMFDGDMWMCTERFHETLDNLICSGRIPPIYAFMVETDNIAERWQELSEDSGIDDFVAGDLLDWARAHYPITGDPNRVIVAGQSLGALSALWTLIKHPKSIRNVISQSASLWRGNIIEYLSKDADKTARDLKGASKARVYLEVGRQEWVLLPLHRQFAKQLAQSGLECNYVEYNGGHDYACWRGSIADGLCWIIDGWR